VNLLETYDVLLIPAKPGRIPEKEDATGSGFNNVPVHHRPTNMVRLY
jgi:hypothetical protein